MDMPNIAIALENSNPKDPIITKDGGVLTLSKGNEIPRYAKIKISAVEASIFSIPSIVTLDTGDSEYFA